MKRNSFEIPQPQKERENDPCNPASLRQDVVRVGLVSESLEGTHRKLSDPSDQYEKTPVIDISFPHGHIRVSNEIRPELLSHLLEGVRGCL